MPVFNLSLLIKQTHLKNIDRKKGKEGRKKERKERKERKIKR